MTFARFRFLDTLRNFVANLGTSRDKASGNVYTLELLDDASLLTMYRTAWLAKKIVNIPAYDATRRWRNWAAKSDQALVIEAEESRLMLQLRVLEAMIVARLYGGSGLFINIGEEDPSTPLMPSVTKKGGVKSFVVFPRSSLSWSELDYNISSKNFGRPKMWDLSISNYGMPVKIHPSRLAVFTGEGIPHPTVGDVFEWSDSVLTSTLTSISQSDAAIANVASLLFEAKIDVVGIPNLMANIGESGYKDTLYSRLEVAAVGKGNNGIFLKDIDETYEQKKMQFSTIPEVMDRFFQNVAGAADIPMTRLFGMSPGGMNSTGDSDLKNYYDRIQTLQNLELTPALADFDECLVRSAFGFKPRGVSYSWASLWQSSEKEEAEISKILSEALKTLSDTETFSSEFMAALSQSVLTERGAMLSMDAVVESLGKDKVLMSKEERSARQPAPRLPNDPGNPRPPNA